MAAAATARARAAAWRGSDMRAYDARVCSSPIGCRAREKKTVLQPSLVASRCWGDGRLPATSEGGSMRLTRAGSLGLLALCLGGPPPQAVEPPAAAGPVIREVRSVVWPAYEAYPRMRFYAPTPAEYARATGDPTFLMERVTYRSDGLD